MSWLFSQVLVEEFSAATCSGCEPSAQLNVMPTPHPFSLLDKTMEPSNLSRFGLTCAVLTEGRGAELLTWFLGAFHARTSALPGATPDFPESAAGSGWKWPGSLAKWDRASSSWKTRQHSVLAGSEQSSVTWPPWGLMRNGELLLRKMPALRTRERDSGFWPTLTASIGRKCGGRHRGKADTLASRLAMTEGLSTTSTGRVNPTWSEWLMGFPSGWSAIEPLETHKFQQWLRTHSGF